MTTFADIRMCGKIERHPYDGDTFIGVRIDLSKDKWALLETDMENYTVRWFLFEKNWSPQKKRYSGKDKDGRNHYMNQSLYPMEAGTENQKADLWAYCDDSERAVLVMNPLFHMYFDAAKD